MASDVLAQTGLSLRNVSIERRGLTLLDGLDLDVGAGETLAVMGPSGSGKTTLLRAIGGLIDGWSGSIDRDSSRVSFVFQDPRLLPWRTVLDNVHLVCPPNRCEAAERWLIAVGLGDAIDLYPAQLSGGMRQRVAIARALAFDASLVLVDEPFASLDAGTAGEIQRLLTRHLRETGRTVLWVTHDEHEALSVAQRTLHLAGPPDGAWKIEHTKEGKSR